MLIKLFKARLLNLCLNIKKKNNDFIFINQFEVSLPKPFFSIPNANLDTDNLIKL